MGGFAFAALWPVMIIFGVHWAFIPIVMNNYAVLGYDNLLPLTVGCNFGIAAATLAIFLKARSVEEKGNRRISKYQCADRRSYRACDLRRIAEI